MMEPVLDPQRTFYSNQALEIGTILRHAFCDRWYGSTSRRRVELKDVETVSTEGGRLARQSLLLVPADEERADVVVLGWIDSAKK